MGYKSKFEPAPFGTAATSSIHGDLEVNGEIYANSYHVDVVTKTITNIEHDGSTKFGDTPDDTHIFTGSMWISGNIGSHRPWLGNDSGSGLGLGGQQQAEQSVGQDFTFYVDPMGGSDYNDGKSSGTALKTVKKACELVPMGLESKYGGLDCDDYNCSGVSALVYCMSGTHVWPSTMWGQNLTRFVGATSSLGSMTGPDWTVISASKEDGSIIEASFLPVTYAEDELKGTFVHLSGSSETGWIYANESSSMPGGETRLWVAKGSYGTIGPEYFLSGDGLVSSSLELINFDTKFQSHRYFNGHTISHANYPAFKNIHFVNSASCVRATLAFVNCHNVVLYANKFGDHRDPDNAFTGFQVVDSEVYMRDSYFDFGDPISPSSKARRVVDVSTNGYLAMERTCVINRGRLTTATDTARLNVGCEVVFRDVTSSLWSGTDNIACYVHKGPSLTTYGLNNGILRFLEFTGSTTCWKGVESNMQGATAARGGHMCLPPMYGKVESDYSVIARLGVHVQIDPNSSVTSSLGINKFSADGGLSETAQTNYLTMITGAGVVAGSLPLEATGFVQYATGSTILGNQVTDTHQVTGTLSLSGSGAGAFGGEGGQLNLFGANTSIVGRHADGLGLGSLHVYCDHKLYLGSRGVDQIGIGRPNPDADFATNTPIFIHTANRTIAISGAMAYKSRESFTANGTASTFVQIIGVDSTAGSFGVELPSATGSSGQVLIVKDEGGDATAFPIALTTNLVETIDGQSSQDLDNNYESLNLYSNGANWFIW